MIAVAPFCLADPSQGYFNPNTHISPKVNNDKGLRRFPNLGFGNFHIYTMDKSLFLAEGKIRRLICSFMLVRTEGF